MSTFSTTHEGLERVLEGTRTLSQAVGPTRSLRAVPLVVLTGIVAAVVVLASRLFGDQIPDGFTPEWLALWALGAFAAVLFARVSAKIGHRLIHATQGWAGQIRRSQEEAALMAVARQDPRVLADLRAAQSRGEFQ